MKKVRVGICHRCVTVGDAIGNDIAGSYAVLERMGLIPEIVCQFPNNQIKSSFRVNADINPDNVRDAYDLLIYHHSIEWVDGESIISRFAGPVVIKYHNITPEVFFVKYSPMCADACRLGREQTSRLVRSNNVVLWQCDSAYNAQCLAEAGQGMSASVIVPPFMRTDGMSLLDHRAVYDPGRPIDLLFVGRRAPNKGHRHLLRMMASFIDFGWPDVRLRIVGADDGELAPYSKELFALSKELGVAANVEWLSQIGNQELDDLFRSSHVYVNASEHEGFCVPIIEAQAIGLPVVTVDAAALRETTGANQVVMPVPRFDEDFDLMAGLVHEV
ncbi:MAG: glycosyltransferase family 4 protein, partial [Saprospiraceae bacterium]|nr:glycosyltransferase family 4 protein [Saprospiraceae bacterium]